MHEAAGRWPVAALRALRALGALAVASCGLQQQAKQGRWGGGSARERALIFSCCGRRAC